MKLGQGKYIWPRGITTWLKNGTFYCSISFTWHLPLLRQLAEQGDLLYNRIVAGGPALKLMPGEVPDNVRVESFSLGVLQRVNPLATKTSTGCIRKCNFCAVPITEGHIKELPDWPDLPIICDNNLLACSQTHFDKAIDRLKNHEWCDFNQGLDSRLLNSYHAKRFKELKNPMLRLALDNMAYSNQWGRTMDMLLIEGIPKTHIRSYALIGFDSGVDEAWARCQFIEKQGIKALPMWFHELNALKRGTVTEKQKLLGWTDYERRRILQWYYQHKRAIL